jgi:hypothetical protein
MIPYRKAKHVTMAPDAPERRRKPSLQKGRPPKAEQDPITLAEFAPSCEAGEERVTWRLARTRATVVRYINGKHTRLPTPQPDDDPEWINCKLYAVETAHHKANFWIAWNDRTRSLNRRADGSALKNFRPQLYDAVQTYFRQVGSDIRELPDWYHRVSRDTSGAVVVELDPMSRLMWALEPRSHIYPMSELEHVRAMSRLLADRGMKFTARALDGPMAGFIEVTRTA